MFWSQSGDPAPNESGDKVIQEDNDTIASPINEEVLAETPTQTAIAEEIASSLSEVDVLLEAGDLALKEDRLTTPDEDNANYYYLKVLEVDPSSHATKKGRLQVANRYRDLAQASFNKGDSAKAREYIGRGLRVQPTHPSLLELMRKVTQQGQVTSTASETGATE